jgi:tight adherence protein B
MDTEFALFTVALFIAVILLVEGLLVGWNARRGPQARRIAHRLRGIADGNAHADRISIRKRRQMSKSPAMESLLMRLPVAGRLDDLLVQSGSKQNVSQLLLLMLVCALAALSCAAWFLPLWAAIAAACAMAAFPLSWLRARRSRRLTRIEAQLPDALDLMSRALRAGHALPTSIQMVSTEMSDPIAGEFGIVFDELNFGIPMADALNGLAARIPGTDVGYFVITVLIQRETGGDLTEVFGNISRIVRERLKLIGHVRSLSAEGRLSAWILSLLPIVLGAMMNASNPKFMSILWHQPAGQKMLGGTIVMMILGMLWMRKVIRIRI